MSGGSTICPDTESRCDRPSRRSINPWGMASLSIEIPACRPMIASTRFVCAHESIAHPLFKRAFIRASARDAVGRMTRNQKKKNAGKKLC